MSDRSWVLEHLDYLPGRDHVRTIEVLAAALEAVGLPQHKAQAVAVFQWRAVQKSKKERRES